MNNLILIHLLKIALLTSLNINMCLAWKYVLKVHPNWVYEDCDD